MRSETMVFGQSQCVEDSELVITWGLLGSLLWGEGWRMRAVACEKSI